MQNAPHSLNALLVITLFLIMLMACFIFLILYLHRKKQLAYIEKVTEIENSIEKTLMASRIEIQEQTFQHISREIHDNISLSLTLAKLQLNTLDQKGTAIPDPKIEQAVNLLSRSIEDLSNLSRGLNTDLLQQQGLLYAVEEEMERIRKTGLFEVKFIVSGEPRFFDAKKELMIFRIIQEAFNNIIKHANARQVWLEMNFENELTVAIKDDGLGFVPGILSSSNQSGIKNMESRVKILGGRLSVLSSPGNGTCIQFYLPIEQLI